MLSAQFDFKDLPRRAAAYKVLRKKAFNNAKSSIYDGYKDLASMAYEFHNKITLDGAVKKRNYAKPANG